MLRRFEAEGYPPEIAAMMKAAFDAALARIPSVKDLTRTLLASVVMDSVDAGVHDCAEIADQAVAMLAVAENLLARAAAESAEVSAFAFECGGARSWSDCRPGGVLVARIGPSKGS
jgi:hypothetical protein